MMNNNFNNGATNNNSNNGKGDFIMATNTIGTMEVFAGTIKSAMEAYFGEGVRVTVQKVTKNNGMILTGLTIMDKTSNLAPTIYLEGYFNDYNCGEPMSDICQRILKVYEENKVTDNFDISMVTNFGRARNRICCKLINAERNAELLADAPHVIIEDLGCCNSRENKYQKSNPYNVVNILIKLSKKRSFTDAILGVASLSNKFSQDEDLVEPVTEGRNPDELKQQPKQERSATKKQIQYLEKLMQEHNTSPEAINKYCMSTWKVADYKSITGTMASALIEKFRSLEQQ